MCVFISYDEIEPAPNVAHTNIAQRKAERSPVWIVEIRNS